MKYELVLFDLDGTTLDTKPGIVRSVVRAVEAMGWEPLSESALSQFIGPPLPESFMRHCGCTEEEAYEARRVFRTHYSAGAMYDAQPYEGIRELLGELAASGCQLGIATNKQQDLAQDLLRHFGFDGFFGGIHGADAEGRREKAETIQLALEHFGVEPTSTVLIGDTAHDATAAAQTGIAFAAVTYGYGFTDEASVAPYPHIGVAGLPAEILGLLD